MGIQAYPTALAACLLALGPCAAAGAQEAGEPDDRPIGEQIIEGLERSFDLPVEELYVRRHENEWLNLLDGLTVVPSFTMPLDRTPGVGASGQGEQEASSPTANLTLRYNPLGHWFATATLTRYIDGDARQPWNGDFTYAFGFDDWHPYTLSLVYSNYGNNRFSPRDGDRVTEFDEGSLTLGWKFPLPRALAEPMLIERDQQINCRVAYAVTPRFDRASGGQGSWKQAASLGCRYPITGFWYLDWTALWYPAGRQQPWDPDYTYGFGYADWRSGTISIQYANYAANRFPWRDGPADGGRFGDGALTLSWNWTF
ncbi:MAG TPA: hypothetical protein VEH84_07420 [Alphaproteobacteria bacterium]|nr:hypothetical protein [Alphaproteobacteria bacterium]